MKFLKIALVASTLLAPAFAVRAASTAQTSLETYYMNPRPAEVPALIRDLSFDGYLARADHRAIAIGFLSTVFTQNPDRVDGWVAEFSRAPLGQQRLVAAALWKAGYPAGANLLRRLDANSPVRSEIEQMAQTTSMPLVATPVVSPASMNLQWGAFLASGNESNIVAILNAIGTGRPGLDEAARFSLAQNAAMHPRVMEICRDQLNKEPDTAQAVLRSALEDAAKSANRS